MVPTETNINRIEDFFNEIVIRAAKDYVLAYRRYLKKPEDPVLQRELQQQEAFFRGDAIRRYTKVDGEYLLRRLKNAVDNGDKLFYGRYIPPVIQENT